MSNNKRQMNVKKNSHESRLWKLNNQIATIQDEREEVTNLINIQVDRDILAAEEILLLGQDRLCEVFDEVTSHLENCIEKLLVIKVQLLSDGTESKGGRSFKEFSGSEGNHVKFGNNNLKVKNEDGEEEGRNIDGDSKHAIQGNSSVRSSPFLESSSPISQSFLRHCCNDEHEEKKRRQLEQTDHGDHYYLEGLKQKEDPLSTTTKKPSYISQSSSSGDTSFNGDPLHKTPMNQRSSNSFDEQEYIIHSGFESVDPSCYILNSTERKSSLTSTRPPTPGNTSMPITTVEKVICCDESSNRNMRHEIPQLMIKSYSNEEIVFRMADERQHQQLGHVPQEHNWTDYSARLSLPTLDPPEHFRDNVSMNELGPPPAAYMVRTPELVNITTDRSCDEEEDVISDVPMVSMARPKMVKQDSSDTKTTTTSSCDRFDTASSEIYFSQDGNSPPDQSLSDSPPLFVATANKPPLASTPPIGSSAPTYRRRTSYPKINIPIGINLSIRISHVNDPSDFWIHVNRDQVNMLFNEIQLLQEKFVQSNHVSVRTPIMGSMYATRYSNDVSWYRVEVLELLSNNYVKILFIDYGFTAKVSALELSILSPLLEDKPAQSFNCFLKGVQAPSGVWTATAVEEFKNSVSFYSVRAIFYDAVINNGNHNNNSRTKYPVDLFLDWGSGEMNNVLLYLSPTEFITNELNMPKESSKEKIVGKKLSGVNMKTGDLKAEMMKEKKRRNFTPIFIDAPTIPEKEYILGVISHVVSPSEFYIHVMPEEDCDGSSQLDDLREQLNEYYNSLSLGGGASSTIFPSDLSILKDSCWSAMFPTDNSWYRVRIIEILEDEDENEEDDNDDEEKGSILHALVQYIDYGNIEVVTLDELRPLSTDMAKTPALAVKCHLAYIKPDGNKWSEEALSFFEQLSGFEQETLVTAHVVYKPNRIDFKTSLSVLLWNNNANNNIDFEADVSDGHDVLINALMVNESLAITDSIEWMEEVEKIHTDQEVLQKVSVVQEATKRILEKNDVEEASEEEVEEEEIEIVEEEEEEEEENVFDVAPFNLSKLAIDSIVLLKITHVESPNEFYGILPSGPSTLDEMECESLQELLAKIETAPVIAQKKLMCDKLKQLLKRDSKVDHYSETMQINQVALISQEENAFRGRILSYSPENECYSVQDVDSGFRVNVAPKNIQKLTPEFLSVPAFCVKCKLANIEPINGNFWSKESIETFKRDTVGSSFAAHVISSDGGILLVELVGLDEDNTVSVCEYLVGLGHGREVPTPEPIEKQVIEIPVTTSKPPIPCARRRRGSTDSQDSKVHLSAGESENV